MQLLLGRHKWGTNWTGFRLDLVLTPVQLVRVAALVLLDRCSTPECLQLCSHSMRSWRSRLEAQKKHVHDSIQVGQAHLGVCPVVTLPPPHADLRQSNDQKQTPRLPRFAAAAIRGQLDAFCWVCMQK